MQRNFQGFLSFTSFLCWSVVAFLALFLFYITIPYWSFRPDINFLLEKEAVVNYMPWRAAFYIHILGGCLAIALGPFQFLKYIRKNFVKAHRLMGKIYVSSILFIAAPTGLYMALFAEGGWLSSIGFTLMAVLWFYTTWVAYRKIRERDFVAHRQWMIRSYAVTFSAVTLRLWVPCLSMLTEVGHETIIVLTSWISWFFNLLFAEFFIFFRSGSFTLKKITP